MKSLLLSLLVVGFWLVPQVHAQNHCEKQINVLLSAWGDHDPVTAGDSIRPRSVMSRAESENDIDAKADSTSAMTKKAFFTETQRITFKNITTGERLKDVEISHRNTRPDMDVVLDPNCFLKYFVIHEFDQKTGKDKPITITQKECKAIYAKSGEPNEKILAELKQMKGIKPQSNQTDVNLDRIILNCRHTRKGGAGDPEIFAGTMAYLAAGGSAEELNKLYTPKQKVLPVDHKDNNKIDPLLGY